MKIRKSEIELKHPHTCRWCGKNKKVVRAHVMPKWMFRGMQGQHKGLMLIRSGESFNATSVNGAPIDKKLTCKGCDEDIGEWEDTLKRLFVDDLELVSASKATQLGTKARIIKMTARAGEVEKALLSILWKASASKLDTFNNFSLGEQEEMVLQYLKGDRRLKVLALIEKVGNSEIAAFDRPNSLAFFPRIRAQGHYEFCFDKFLINVAIGSSAIRDVGLIARTRKFAKENIVIIEEDFWQSTYALRLAETAREYHHSLAG